LRRLLTVTVLLPLIAVAQERPDLEQFAIRLESDAPAALKQLPLPGPELLSFLIARAKNRYDRFDFAGAIKGYRGAAGLARHTQIATGWPKHSRDWDLPSVGAPTCNGRSTSFRTG